MTDKFKLGAVGQYGQRGVMRDKYTLVCLVPLPSANNPIEERRAARDAMAERIVYALNQTESHKINEEET